MDPIGNDPGQEPDFTMQEEQDDVAKITSLIRELDLSGGSARIWRQAPDSAKFHYWGEVPADTFSLEHVRLKYGGGDYLVRFAAKGGRYVRSIKFSIDPSFIGELPQRQAAAAAASSTSTHPAGAHAGPNDTMLAYMMQQAQSAQQQNASMMALMVTMMSESQKSMASVIGAALSGKQPVPVQGTDSRMFELMTPLIAESLRPRGGVGELIETVKAVRELTDGQGQPQPPKEEDNMIGKIATLATPLLQVLMSRGQNQQPPQPPQHFAPPPPQPHPTMTLPPVGPASLPNPTQPNPSEAATLQKAEELLSQLRMFTPMLVSAAKKNAPLDFYLEALDSNLDDDAYSILCALLEQDDWVKVLFGNNPGVMANIGWFNNLRETILNDEGEATGPQQGEDPGEVQRPG